MTTPTPPAVTVITPLYNRCDLIGDAIASVMAQTHPAVEMIVCDDGSTDGGDRVVQEMAIAHSGLRLVRQANRGPSAARNRALRAVSTRIVTFLDSDDVMAPDRIAAQLRLLEDADIDLVIGREHIEVAPGIPEPRWVRELPPAEVAPRWYTMSMLLDVLWLDRVRGFDEAIDVGEDIDLLVRLRAAGARVGLLDEVVVTRRITGDNMIYREDEVATAMVRAMHKHLRTTRATDDT